MKQVWNFLNGKKTAIGAVLLIACGIPHLEQWIDTRYIDIIYYLGTALGAGGVLHKVAKGKRLSDD